MTILKRSNQLLVHIQAAHGSILCNGMSFIEMTIFTITNYSLKRLAKFDSLFAFIFESARNHDGDDI